MLERCRMIILVCLVVPLLAKAQPSDTAFVVPLDSTTIVITHKHPWLAGLEIVGLNASIVAYNRIFRSEDGFSQIKMSDIRRNITHRHWWWDSDYFHTNAIEHPFHGSLYYLISRFNGMDAGVSSLYALGGSWMWEMFCESELPSINDMVYTVVGGVAIGEALYRTTHRIWDMLPLSRRHRRDTTPFETSIVFGMRRFVSSNQPTVSTPYLTWSAAYGDLLNPSDNGFFGTYNLQLTAVFGHHQSIVSRAFVHSQLWSRQLTDTPLRKSVIGLYNHFDYHYVLPSYELPEGKRERHPYVYSEVGAIGPGLAYRLGDKVRWEQQLHVNAILMGTTPIFTEHARSRGYGFGSGYGAKIYTKAHISHWLRLQADAECSHLFTWDGFYDDDTSRTVGEVRSIQGETGNVVTCILSPSVELRPWPHFAVEWQGRYIYSHFNYRYHPHFSENAWEWHAGAKYIF